MRSLRVIARKCKCSLANWQKDVSQASCIPDRAQQYLHVLLLLQLLEDTHGKAGETQKRLKTENGRQQVLSSLQASPLCHRLSPCCSVQLLPWKLLLWSTELAQSTAFLEEGTHKYLGSSIQPANMSLLRSLEIYDTQSVLLCWFHKNFLNLILDKNLLEWIIRRGMNLRSKEGAKLHSLELLH